MRPLAVPAFAFALLCLAVPSAQAADIPQGCMIGFDIGSSGLRVGLSDASGVRESHQRISVDALGDVWAHGGLTDSIAPTVAALRDMPAQQDFPSECRKVAGGYSAWRLAAEKNGPAQLAERLRSIHQASGAFVFVIPQRVEGRYGYIAARRTLGAALTTPYILDIGGGSLQIAGENGGWGAALGQNAWRKLYCQADDAQAAPDCALNPLGDQAKAKAQHLLADDIAQARRTLGSGFSATGVSISIVHGMHPLLLFYAKTGVIPADSADAQGFDRTGLDAALAHLGRLNDDQIAADLAQCRQSLGTRECDPHFAAVTAGNMLLLDTLMTGLAIDRLQVGEADITNVPGILADTDVRRWTNHYECYLSLLAAMGPDALTTPAPACAAQPLEP